MTDRLDDVALLEAHVAGDPGAFAELFARHRGRMWAVALRTTGNREEAEDALQDALVSAFRRAESFRGDAAVSTWLHRIVVNAALDRLRRAKVRAADPLPDDLGMRATVRAVAGATDPRSTPPTNPRTDPEARALADERRSAVWAALADLAPEQRAALVLVDMEGYPVQEVARILETPVGTIKSRCARGRARLAVLLADLGDFGVGPVTAPTRPPGTDMAGTASHSGDPPPVRTVHEPSEIGRNNEPEPRQGGGQR